MTSRIDYNDPKRDKSGTFCVSYHYEMLSDTKRVQPFAAAIEERCPGKIVFESGTGSGILSILAARAGASRVYCTEIDPKMADVAEANIVKNGLASRVTLLRKNTLAVTLDDLNGLRPDVIIAENLSTWQVTEPQNEVVNHLRAKIAHSDTIAIPLNAKNYVELCDSTFRFMDAVELRAHYFQFTGIASPILRSKPTLFSEFDYSGPTSTFLDHEIAVSVTSKGIVNSLRLTSPLEVSKRALFDSSDSLMPPVVVPLPEDVSVEIGDTVFVRIQYATNSSWEEVCCTARVERKPLER